MEDIIKTIKSLDEFRLIIKGEREAIENEAKEQKGDFISILLGTLGASLLGNMLPGKGVIQAGQETFKVLMPPHPLNHFEIQRYHQNDVQLKFNE